MAQTRGRTGGKCEIFGIYVSGCCENLMPFAIDSVLPSCSCGRETTWFFLQHERGPKRRPRTGGVKGGGADHR